MAKVVNIDRCFEKFNDTYSPKIIEELNGKYVIVKLLLFEPTGIAHTCIVIWNQQKPIR